MFLWVQTLKITKQPFTVHKNQQIISRKSQSWIPCVNNIKKSFVYWINIIFVVVFDYLIDISRFILSIFHIFPPDLEDLVWRIVPTKCALPIAYFLRKSDLKRQILTCKRELKLFQTLFEFQESDMVVLFCKLSSFKTNSRLFWNADRIYIQNRRF